MSERERERERERDGGFFQSFDFLNTGNVMSSLKKGFVETVEKKSGALKEKNDQ